MASDQYPRILIISEGPFCLDNGFGVTLSTFFKGWTKDNLFMLYAHKLVTPSTDICGNNVYVDIVGNRGLRDSVPFFLGQTPAWRGKYSLPWLKKQLNGFRPQAVYSLLFSPDTLAFADWASRQLHCPHVMHLADAHNPINLDQNLVGTLKQIYARAAKRIVISEEMRQVYEGFYKLDFSVMHNGADAELFANDDSKNDERGAFIVRYVGSVVPRHHFNAFEDIVIAVKEFKRFLGPIRFEIYGAEWTSQYVIPLTDNVSVIYGGKISREDNFALLKSADLLVVPISFDPSELDANRLSFPTKLPEYLASGTPTLIYGPSGCAPVEFCRRNNLGILKTERSVEGVLALLKELQANRLASRQKASADADFIKHNLSADKMREEFMAIITSAVQTTSAC